MADPVSAGCCTAFFTQLLGSLTSLCGGGSGGPTSISVRCTNMFNNCICCQSCQWGQNTNVHQETTYTDRDSTSPVKISNRDGNLHIARQPRNSSGGSSASIIETDPIYYDAQN